MFSVDGTPNMFGLLTLCLWLELGLGFSGALQIVYYSKFIVLH